MNYPGEGNLWKPLVASFIGHLLIVGIFLYWPAKRNEPLYLPSVINVRMVTLPQPKPMKTPRQTKALNKKPKVKAPKPQPKPDAIGLGKKKSGPRKAKPKISMKHKTYKSKKVLRSAIKELERKVETAPPEHLAEALKRLKEKVESVDVPPNVSGSQKGRKAAINTSIAGGARGKQVSDLLTIYRVEIAYQVQKHWAFSRQLAGDSRNLTTGVIFKVLPDGQITDIIITDHSDNAYLDESAKKAILKSSPVSPHPPGLNLPYVTVGLRFTPEGVR